MIEVKAKSFKNDIPFLVSILDLTISWYFTLCFLLEIIQYELKNPSSFPGVSAKEMKEMKKRRGALAMEHTLARSNCGNADFAFLLVFLHSGNRKTRVCSNNEIHHSLNGNKLE